MKKFKDIVNNLSINKKVYGIDEAVIDPPHKDRAEFLFDEDGLIRKSIKAQIYNLLSDWKKNIDKDFDITEIHLKGSLLGYQYSSDSDLDISVKTTLTDEEIKEISSALPDGKFIKVDGKDTLHPLDFFLLSKDSVDPSLDNFDFYYDLGNDKWLKESEPYKSDLSVNYVLKVGSFLIDGINIAIGKSDKNMLEYSFYEEIDSKNQDFNEEERKKLLAKKYDDAKVSLEELRLAKFIFLSMRREGYRDGEKIPFYVSIQKETENPHSLFGEVFQKSIERMKIREKLETQIKEVENFLEEKKPIEEK